MSAGVWIARDASDNGMSLEQPASDIPLSPDVATGKLPSPSGNGSAPDPFDPATLRLSQDYAASLGVKKALLTIPVKKPDKSWFVRAHPDEAYHLNTCVIELKTDQELYLVSPHLWPALAGESTFVPKALFTAISRQGVLFVWHVRLPGADGKIDAWSQSALARLTWPSRVGCECPQTWALVPMTSIRPRPIFRNPPGPKCLSENCYESLSRTSKSIPSIIPCCASCAGRFERWPAWIAFAKSGWPTSNFSPHQASGPIRFAWWLANSEAVAFCDSGRMMVLPGFPLRTDAKVVRWPDRYMDDRGKTMWEKVQTIFADLGSSKGEGITDDTL